jgi:hypothetical protein
MKGKRKGAEGREMAGEMKGKEKGWGRK